jgi:hypothetical protein
MNKDKILADYDVRVRERNLKSGLLRKDEVERHLASLIDVAEHAQLVDVSQPGTGPAVEEPEPMTGEPTP